MITHRLPRARPVTLADIADTRAYERERDDFRRHIVALKAVRRVALGTLVSVVFECADTVRWQVQEMARVEGIRTDAGIETELDIYNALVPGGGELSATLFIECVTDAQMREWFPKLVGIERALELRVGDHVVRSVPEAAHERQLTRDELTSAVHYLRFPVGAVWADALERGPARLACVHPAYQEETALAPSTLRELAADVRGG